MKRNIVNEEDATYEALTLTRSVTEGTKVYGGDYDTNHWYTIPDTKSSTIEYRNQDGKLHRLCGPAVVNRRLQMEMWYADGKLHRDDGGPAYTHKHIQKWYNEGKLHRMEGPAVVGQGRPREYWIDGSKLSPREHKKELQRRVKKGLL